MSDTQINVGMNVDGVATGVNKAKAELRTLQAEVDKVSKLSKEGGAALVKVGDGVDSDKAVKQLSRLAQQVKRVSEEAVLGRNSVELFADKLAKTGVASDVYKPLLDSYAKVKQSSDLANAAFTQSGKVMTEYGMGVKATSAALRQVPAQFTDIFVSLQGGQAPLTVLLQQGGQLKDVFGGVGNAFKALSSYVLGLINPFTVAVAAVGSLAYAWQLGAEESRAYSKALILSGNQAGTTSSQLMAMAASIDQLSGTQGAAAEALALFAASGKIGAENLEKFTLTAIRFEKVTGTAIGDTVKKFEELRKAPLEATLKLNDSMGYLTQGIYDQIKALMEQGRATEAAMVAQQAFDQATANMATDMEKNLGTVERAWNDVKSAVKETLDAIKGIGRDAGLEGQVAAAQKIVDVRRQAANSIYGTASDRTKLSEAENQLKGYQELLKNQQLSAKYAAERTESVKQLAAYDKRGEAYLDKAAKMERALNADRIAGNKLLKEGLITQEAYEKRLDDIRASFAEKGGSTARTSAALSEAAKGLKLYNDLMDQGAGLTANFAEQQGLLTAKFNSDGNLEQYQEGMARLIAQQPYMTASLKAEADAIAAIEKARNSGLQSHAKELESLGEKAQKLEDEVAMYGMSKEAIEELTTARMLDRVEILRGFDNSAEEIARIEETIAARKRLAAASSSLDVKDANEKATKDMLADQKKAAEESGKWWEEKLMDAFTAGMDGWNALWDTIKNTLKTQVLKVTVQGVMGTLGLGAAGAASASTLSTAGDAAGIAGFGSNVISGLGLAATGFGQAAAATFSNGLIAGFSTNMANIGALASGGSMVTALGAAVPYIGAVLAVGSIAKSLFDGGGGPKAESTYGAGYAPLGNTSATGLAGTYARGVEDAWTVLARQLNLSTQLKVGAQTSVDTQGDAQTIFDANASINGATVSSRYNRLGGAENVGRSEEALQAAMAEEMTRMLFAALKASDLPEQYKTYLNGIADDVASMSTAMSNVTVVSDFNKALQSLPFENLKNLSFDAAYGLIQFAGGMEALGANLGTYYTNFYREDEQRAQAIKNIDSATGGVLEPLLKSLADGTRPAQGLRDSFRAIVEEQDLTTESGQRTYAALIGVSGAFAELTPVLDGAAASATNTSKALNDAIASLRKDGESLAVELLRAQGDNRGADFLSMGVNPNDPAASAVVAQYDANQATRALISSLNDLSEAAITAADASKTITDSLTSTGISLRDEYDVLTGVTTARDVAIRGYTAEQIALYDANAAMQTSIDTYKATAASITESAAEVAAASRAITEGLVKSGISLRDEYDVLTGVTTARDVAIRGYTAEQIALYDANAALQASIDLRKEEKTAIETSAASLQSLITKYTAPLTISGAQSQVAAAFNPSVVDTLMGQSSTGFSDLVLEYAQSLDPLTEAGRAAIAQLLGLVPALDVMAGSIQTAETTARDLANAADAAATALANTNQGWQDQLDILNGAATDRSLLLRDAGDESTKALMQLVWAAQDLKTASDAAAQAAAQAAEESMRIKTQAAEEAARVAKQIAETNLGWQNRLDILLGKETENSIALRDATDETTRALMRQVFAQEDLNAAAEVAAALAETNKGWQDQLDILTGKETERSIALRDAGDASTRALMQQVYAQQDLKTAAEELTATWQSATDSIFDEVKRIRGLSSGGTQSYAQAQSAFAIATAQARAGDVEAAKLLPSLSQAMLGLAEQNVASAFDLQLVQAGTAGSLETTNAWVGANHLNQPAPQQDAQSASEIRSLRADNRVQAQAMTELTARMVRLIERWEAGGMPQPRAEV